VYEQWFAIYVQEMPPVTPTAFVGELNLYDEDTITATNTSSVLVYTVPADRALRVRQLECFGRNIGGFELLLNGDRIGFKETYYTYYETEFNLDNFKLDEGDVLEVKITNRGSNTALFNARLRGYQYAK
jgi:hypothetical protein